ncbi:hypothetical protein D051_4038 [Vibrio parahaemolyticus VPCR-2010]|nr:hypothetical protein D051_4038 [Vibrio parahaemolyticus VPCR-2010]
MKYKDLSKIALDLYSTDKSIDLLKLLEVSDDYLQTTQAPEC